MSRACIYKCGGGSVCVYTRVLGEGRREGGLLRGDTLSSQLLINLVALTFKPVSEAPVGLLLQEV